MRLNIVQALAVVSVGCALAFPTSAATPTSLAEARDRAESAPASFAGDPIGFVAHGQLFDDDGKPFEPSAAFIRDMMEFYVDRLWRLSSEKRRAEAARVQAMLAKRFSDDELTQRFLLMELLLQDAAPQAQAQLSTRAHVLRKHWYMDRYGLARYKKLVDPRRNYPSDILAFGEDAGIILKATEASGRKYIAECRDAGVPIPPRWRGGGWTYEGDLATNFLGLGNPTEVWRADSSSPPGLCVALPRFASESSISALGIICLGTESSNACFYDAENVGKDEALDPEDLISGADLFNGVCTDCHAGENPFIVHPGGPLDMWPDNQPAQWYTPLIKPSWPQNPGPLTALSQVAINPLPPDNDASCLECHSADQFGRFPDVLALNAWSQGLDGTRSGYCRAVLENAVGSTMPGLGSAHDKHAQAMLAFCQQSPTPPEEVPPPRVDDDPGLLGPPVVIPPLYGCTKSIQVTGASYDARLTVRIDGADVATETVKAPSLMTVKVPPLAPGQVVTAFQEENGVVSPESVPVIVLDHKVHYPNGLPLPTIDPTLIHECGRVIAVRHIRGAQISVFTNGANEVKVSGGRDWTNVAPAIRPFNFGDRYAAQQSICGDPSGITPEEEAVSEPAPMPIPDIDPTPPIAGQELIALSNLPNGALTEVSESTAGVLTTFSTAVSWSPEVDIATGLGHPLMAGEDLTVVSALCDSTKVGIPEARPCERLEAPRIAQPLVGDTQVTVTDAVPGAHVIVYDAALDEIGDGSGTPIGLTRALVPGDVLTVIQKLGQCSSASAYQISAVCSSKEACG